MFMYSACKIMLLEVGLQFPTNYCLGYQMLEVHHTYAEELSFIKRRASSSHALGFRHVRRIPHRLPPCVFLLEIQLQFVSLDGALIFQFYFGMLRRARLVSQGIKNLSNSSDEAAGQREVERQPDFAAAGLPDSPSKFTNE